MTTAPLADIAHRVMTDLFDNRDVTTVDRHFAAPFVQHDPNLIDGLEGVRSFAAEVASAPAPGITIFRTLVDGDRVLLHSRYEGLAGAGGPLLAMDLFRFRDDRIVEHWGGQQPESPERNLSGHTQVDGPTTVEDLDRTEANRALLQTYRNTITVEQHYDRIDDFLATDYVQHAEGFGDGIARVKARYALDVKPGTSHVLTPRFFVAQGNFVLSVVDARTDPPKANFDLFRVAAGRIAEHWEVLSTIPLPDQRKNANGAF